MRRGSPGKAAGSATPGSSDTGPKRRRRKRRRSARAARAKRKKKRAKAEGQRPEEGSSTGGAARRPEPGSDRQEGEDRLAALGDQIAGLIAANRGFAVPREPVFLAAYCDASLRRRRTAGWAMWGRDQRRRVLASGVCPRWVRSDANLAELCAVAGAVWLCLAHLDRASAHILVVKTDSQAACRWFGWTGTDGEGPFLPRGEPARELVAAVLQGAARAGVKLVVTWVKGHQGSGTTRGYLNDRVDNMARKARLQRSWSLWRAEVGSDLAPESRQEPDRGLPFRQALAHHFRPFSRF